MPLYEYQCDACHERFERIQKFSDPLVDVCPKCGSGPVRKLLSSPAIQFKGSGWYVTDYARKSGDGGKAKESKPSSSDTSSASKSTSDASSTSKPAESSSKTD